jgi:hypothetical protein
VRILVPNAAIRPLLLIDSGAAPDHFMSPPPVNDPLKPRRAP